MLKKDVPVEPGAQDEARFIASMKRLREEREWSQGELARRLAASGWEGVYQTTISRLEKGERPVRLGEAKAIAEVFNTGVTNMMAPSDEAKMIDGIYLAIRELDKLRLSIAEQMEQLVEAHNSLARLTADALKKDAGGSWEDERTKTIVGELLPLAQQAMELARKTRYEINKHALIDPSSERGTGDNVEHQEEA